jgi:solute carrier family 45, member 1/2/4
LLAFDGEDEDAELARLQDIVHQWRAEAARRGKPLRVPAMPLTLRNIWTGALLLFSVITFSTFFISTVTEVFRPQYCCLYRYSYDLKATVAIALVGICWAVAIWVPFAIVMEVTLSNS